MTVVAIETPHGLANAHLRLAAQPRAALVLGHGAGGGVTARDLVTAVDAALAESISAALVEQPYRVAGRRSPAPAHQLDAAWIAVVEQLRADVLDELPLVTGGRSSGARVACRTAAATGAAAVLCLAFPSSRRGARAHGQAGSTSWTPSPCLSWWCRELATRSACRLPARRAQSFRCRATTASVAISRRSARRCAAGSRRPVDHRDRVQALRTLAGDPDRAAGLG